MKKHIFIVGARGYKFNYGGWETFVTNLILNNKDESFSFYVPHLTYEKERHLQSEQIDGITRTYIYTPEKGFATMFLFTIKSLNYVRKYIKKHHLKNTVVLILGCKVGPILPFWTWRLRNTKFIINPDGLEWQRDKWAWWIKQCFKLSEFTSMLFCDYCVCDSKSIQSYVDKKYHSLHIPTSYIAFGAYENGKPKKNEIVKELWKEYGIKDHEYYLIVGRFVPENNYETMIKEFMKTKTKKDLVIICNLEKNKFYEHLQEETNFEKDKRIKFIGSLYDSEALLYFRQHAFGYLHGHSAGGTNPSLLEALSNTELNILYDVCYNREVGEDACFYYTKEPNNLKKVIEKVEHLSQKEIHELGKKAKQRIHDAYTWDSIVTKYEEVFDKLLKEK